MRASVKIKALTRWGKQSKFSLFIVFVVIIVRKDMFLKEKTLKMDFVLK